MRTIAAFAAFALMLACMARAGPARDDHGSAIAAIADVQAAVAEIVRIENGDEIGRDAYVRAAHRALNALVGRDGENYARAFGDPGDGIGTLGHVDRMLDQNATLRWTPAVEGAKANVLAAAEDLQDAIGERELEDYQIDLTRALANLALVVGRPSTDGVLGGLSGALANTDLGVPSGARRASACKVPARTPAYGVRAGRLVYVALPRTIAAAQVPVGLDIRSIVVSASNVVLYTGSASAVARSCATADPPPALYTREQARAGAAVYARYCLQCHGTDLQGTAGPAVAGTEFLKTAKFDGWSLRDVRTTVFENMPFSNPGSLTPRQYAEATAFLLASSCYPAGSKPFPQSDEASLAAIKLGPITAAKPTNAKNGTCAVK